MLIAEILSYPFLARALAVGFLVSISASLLGVSLVLRRYSMIGDGLSHVGFGALGIASVLAISPMALTIPVVMAASFFLLRISEKNSGDSAIALISSSSLAIGVIAVSLGGVNTNLNSFLFGSILSVSEGDAVISAAAALLTLIVYIGFYHQIYAATFDPVFAQATGIRCERYTTILALLTSLIIVVGMRMLGSLLISSLIIFPAASAMQISKTYLSVSIISAAESAIAFLIGFAASYAFSLPTGAAIVAVHMIIFLVSYAIGRGRKRMRKQLS